MLFTPENAIKVLDGSKTQTRRPVKQGEIYDEGKQAVVIAPNDLYRRLKWQSGQTYAIQPGRGKKAIGYKVLKSIRQERLQDISEADCCLETGAPLKWHGPGPEPYKRNMRAVFAILWDSIYGSGLRWEDNPEVWVLEFEAVKR